MSRAAGSTGREALQRQIEQLGLREGMDVLVHSSLRRLPPDVRQAETVIDVLLEILTPSGTLMMPAHSWSRVGTDQPVFDVLHTPSCVGALTEAFRQRAGVVRSLHPTHSVAALGARAEHYTSGQLEANTACGPDSPYMRLCTGGGHILLLGVTMMNNTTLHALEEEADLTFLWHDAPRLRAVVIDAEGRRHRMDVRGFSDARRRYAFWVDLEHVLAEAGAMRIGRVGNGLSRLIEAGAMREIVLPILREHPDWLYLPAKEG
jgi:aminoglycoside 3-N-acetyltransferase